MSAEKQACPFKAGDTVANVVGYGDGHVSLVNVAKVTPSGQVVLENGRRYRLRYKTWDLIGGARGFGVKNALEVVTDKHRAWLLSDQIDAQITKLLRAGLHKQSLASLTALKAALDVFEAALVAPEERAR